MSQTMSGSFRLADREFIEAFETCALPNAAFHHLDHLRLAWLYLREAEFDAATKRFARNLLHFATHHGGAKKYHHTVTVAWMRLIAAAMREAPAVADFEELLALHPRLLDRKVLLLYYTPARLASPAARTGWVEPDLQPLP